MFELIASQLDETSALSFFRVFGYISVRAGMALVMAFVFCVVFGKMMISRLRNLQALQPIRHSTGEGAISLDEMHGLKRGTPTMGGLLMLAALVLSILLFSDWKEPVVWLAAFAAIGFCGIGFLDDYLKVVKKHHGGLSSKGKLLLQGLVGGIFALVFMTVVPGLVSYTIPESGELLTGPQFLFFPFFKNAVLPLGFAYVVFAIVVLTATGNAVNLTDGQDGLAAGVTISVTICFAIASYLAGRVDMSNYLIVPYVRGAGEVTVLLAALCGSCLGFLWWNSHPAEVFMGDTGSMLLGGMVGASALLVKQEFLLLIAGGIYVAEALSVIIQVGSWKLRHKRVFAMAPLHHHFEKSGVPESKVTARFWIVSALLCLAGLVTLKFR